jgi:hypothetical protein
MHVHILSLRAYIDLCQSWSYEKRPVRPCLCAHLFYGKARGTRQDKNDKMEAIRIALSAHCYRMV